MDLSNPPHAGERDRRPVLVHVAQSSFEAYGLRARLEAEEIPVFLKGESEGPYRMAYTQVFLYVPEDVEVHARLIIGQALSGGLSLPATD